MHWVPKSAAHTTGALTAAQCAAWRSAPNVHSQARQQRSFCSHVPAAFQPQRTLQNSRRVLNCRQRRLFTITAQHSQQTKLSAAAAEDLLIVGTPTCVTLLQRHWQAATRHFSLTGGSEVCLLAGPGVLGSYVGKVWREQHASAAVVGQTNTPDNHARCSTLLTSGSALRFT